VRQKYKADLLLEAKFQKGKYSCKIKMGTEIAECSAVEKPKTKTCSTANNRKDEQPTLEAKGTIFLLKSNVITTDLQRSPPSLPH
jgi:hypothetical protein